ncbi:hypothetical protein ACH3WN_32600 [Streptomyces albogriseolus]|uniref:hypothetical protein n=1 Tax=Streptomyces albogriseolus TaxID=1887 RepID=UPI0037976326
MSSARSTVADAAGDVAGRKRSSWHQHASAYVAELQAELDRFRVRSKMRGNQTSDTESLLDKAEVQLEAAREALNERDTLHARFSGSIVDRTWANIHRAELSILKLTDEDDLAWWGTEVLARAEQHLGVGDPIRRELESQVKSHHRRLGWRFKDLAVRALRAANNAEDLERSRLRSFGNILLTSIILATIIAGLLVLWGYLQPQAIAKNLCFTTPPPASNPFCPIGTTPSGGDVLIVELFGLGGAALAGAVSLRNMRGTATPYLVPMYLLLLRLPVGALAAVFGLLIIQGGFVPGFSNLDSSAQVLAWSLLFGIAQESVTRLIDQQGRKVIGNVRGPSRGFEEEPESSSARPETPVGPTADGHRKQGLRQTLKRHD